MSGLVLKLGHLIWPDLPVTQGALSHRPLEGGSPRYSVYEPTSLWLWNSLLCPPLTAIRNGMSLVPFLSTHICASGNPVRIGYAVATGAGVPSHCPKSIRNAYSIPPSTSR